MYKQYQLQNDNEEGPEEDPKEQGSEEDLEAKEKRENLIVYGMMGVLGLFIIFLLAGSIYKKETTRVSYRDAGTSSRVIKNEYGQITTASENEQNTEKYADGNITNASDSYEVDGNTSHIKDLYDSAVENGFTGTREEFYELLNKWNYSEIELEKNFEKLQELIRQAEDSANGEDGKDGADGENGRDGTDGRDGRDGRDGTDGRDGKDGKNGDNGKDGENGKDAYEIAVDAGFTGTRDEWLQSIKGEDGAFSSYKITSNDNNVFLYKETD